MQNGNLNIHLPSMTRKWRVFTLLCYESSFSRVLLQFSKFFSSAITEILVLQSFGINLLQPIVFPLSQIPTPRLQQNPDLKFVSYKNSSVLIEQSVSSKLKKTVSVYKKLLKKLFKKLSIFIVSNWLLISSTTKAFIFSLCGTVKVGRERHFPQHFLRYFPISEDPGSESIF